jgi:hypothetical protein
MRFVSQTTLSAMPVLSPGLRTHFPVGTASKRQWCRGGLYARPQNLLRYLIGGGDEPRPYELAIDHRLLTAGVPEGVAYT